MQTATIATLIAVALGIVLAGWMFYYRGWGRGLWDGILTLPLVLPPTVVGFLLLWLLGRRGPLGQLLGSLDITVIFSWWATVIAAAIVAIPLVYRASLGAFHQVDPDLLAIARTLGASEGRVFRQVLLPLAWPGILAGTILAFARALGEFGATLMVAGSIPGRTQTLPIAIYLAAAEGKTNLALAWVGLMVALGLGTIALLNYTTDRNRSHPVIDRWTGSRLDDARLDNARLKSSRGDASGSCLQTAATDRPSAWDPTLQVSIDHPLASFNLSLAFQSPPQPLGILGASGSGKTMTLRCLAGLETPQRGQIVVKQRVLLDRDRGLNVPSQQRRVGLVLQNYALFPHLSVAQNIAFGLQHCAGGDRHKQVRHYLQQFQLSGLENRYPRQLSGGQQQRVALARALAPGPDVLLLDEPLSALDSHLRGQVEELLRTTCATYPGPVIWVTHCLEELYRCCPQVVVLDRGRVIAQGETAHLFEQPPNVETARLMGCQNLSRLALVPGSSPPAPYHALDWGCHLGPFWESRDREFGSDRSHPSHVGIYGHHLSLSATPTPQGLPCWLHRTRPHPHHITVWVRLSSDPVTALLQVTLSPQQWSQVADHPQPWCLSFEPQHLIWMVPAPQQTQSSVDPLHWEPWDHLP